MKSFQLRYFKDLKFFHNTHSNYEIVWVINGCLTVSLVEKNVSVRKGEAIYLPPYFVHAFITEDTSECCIWEFTTDLIPEKLPDDVVVFNLTDSADKMIYKVKNEDNILTHKAAIYHILSVMSNDSVKKYSVTLDDVCLLTLKFIADNYAQPITLRDAANHLCVNYSHLSRNFKKFIGLSFTNCLNSTRLTKTLGLLTRTGMPITEIALSCGFGSVRNFNRLFMDKYKCSPYEYRKNHNPQ